MKYSIAATGIVDSLSDLAKEFYVVILLNYQKTIKENIFSANHYEKHYSVDIKDRTFVIAKFIKTDLNEYIIKEPKCYSDQLKESEKSFLVELIKENQEINLKNIDNHFCAM